MQTGDFCLVFIVWPLESSLYLTVVRFKQSLCKTANWITFLVCCLILKHPPGDFKGFSGSTDIKRSSVWSVSVFVTHLTRFYKHTRYINDWAELHCSDVCSQHICFPLLHFFQTLCLIHLALNPSSYNVFCVDRHCKVHQRQAEEARERRGNKSYWNWFW